MAYGSGRRKPSIELEAAKRLATKVLAIGTWTSKATSSVVAPMLLSEASETIRLFLAGKIEQFYAKTDGSGVVFLMSVPTATATATATATEADALLAQLPLGLAELMTFETIALGPLWPLGLLIEGDRRPGRPAR